MEVVAGQRILKPQSSGTQNLVLKVVSKFFIDLDCLKSLFSAYIEHLEKDIKTWTFSTLTFCVLNLLGHCFFRM